MLSKDLLHKYQIIAENVGDVIWIYDINEDRFTFVSPSIVHSRGYSPSEVLQQSFKDVFTTDSFKKFDSSLKSRIKRFESGDKSAGVQKDVVYIKRKDGLEVSIEIVSTLVSDEQGKVTEIVGVDREISGRSERVETFHKEPGKQTHNYVNEEDLIVYGVKYSDKNFSLDKQFIDNDYYFKQLVENAPYPILIQMEYKFAYLNRRAVALFHASSPEQLIGLPVVDFAHSDFKKETQERVERLNKEQKSIPLTEAKINTLDNKVVDVEVAAVPLHFKDKNGALVFMRDITLQKKYQAQLLENEQALRKQNKEYLTLNEEYETINEELRENNEKLLLSEQRFSKVFHNNPAAMSLTNFEDGTIIDVNKSFQEILGFDREILLGRTTVELNIYSDQNKRDWIIRKIKANEPVNNLELILKTKSGEQKEVLVSYETLFINGQLCLLSAFQDISAKKRTEEALKKNRELLNEMGSMAKIAGWEVDVNTMQITWTNELGHIFDLEPGQQPDAQKFMSYYTEESRPIMEKALQEAIEKGKPYDLELDLISEKGVHKWIRTISQVKMENGRVIKVRGSLQDITERVLFEKELQRAKEKAEESDRLKTVFLQNMSHEIRTPLNAIMGFAELLPDNFDDKDKLATFASIISQRGTDLLELINDLLELSKIEAGQMSLNIEECDLHKFLADVQETFFGLRKKMHKDHIDIAILHVEKPLPIIFIDKAKLRQIFINLINNALKFTDNGKIEIGYTFSRNRVEFFVSDTGIGIPADKQDEIFKRFRQLKHKGEQQAGTGLGLAIVKGLVEFLGGEIKLSSVEKEGSKFSFSLPCKIGNTIANEKEETSSSIPNQMEKDILLLEDDYYSSEYIKEIFSGSGYNLYHVSTGQEAIDFIESHPIDVFLVDIRLPDMEGYEVVRKVRDKIPKALIIAETAYAAPSDYKSAIESGCDDYISKPVNKKQLLAMIQEHLDKKN